MKLLNKVFQRSKLAVCLSAVLALTACDSDKQDQGSPSTNSVSLTGVVIDGYLAGATVYIDSDNSGSLDAWEPSAFTDNEGYYTVSKSGLNYCTSSDPLHAKHCLKSKSSFTDAVIRIEGGSDVLTGQKFIGQISRRVAKIAPSETGAIKEDTIPPITPLSTLFTEVKTTTEKQALLKGLGIAEDDLDVDYLKDETVEPKLLNVALKAHKTVSVLADKLADTYDELGNGLGTPNDATSIVYKALAEELIKSQSAAQPTSFDDFFSTDNQGQSLQAVLGKAKGSLDDLYAKKDYDKPQKNVADDFDRLVTISTGIAKSVDNIVSKDKPVTLANAKAASIGVEALVIKAVDEETVPDPKLDNAISFYSKPSPQLDNVLTSLAKDNADSDAAAESDYSPATLLTLEKDLLLEGQPFHKLANTSLRVSDDYEEVPLLNGNSEVNDSEFIFYLESDDPDATTGPLVVCAKYIEDAEKNATTGQLTLEKDSTEGDRIKGSWALVAPNAAGESYTLNITLDYLNNEYTALLKAKGENDEGKKEFRFSFLGEEDTFESDSYFTDIVGNVPATVAACKAELPRREK